MIWVINLHQYRYFAQLVMSTSSQSEIVIWSIICGKFYHLKYIICMLLIHHLTFTRTFFSVPSCRRTNLWIWWREDGTTVQEPTNSKYMWSNEYVLTLCIYTLFLTICTLFYNQILHYAINRLSDYIKFCYIIYTINNIIFIKNHNRILISVWILRRQFKNEFWCIGECLKNTLPSLINCPLLNFRPSPINCPLSLFYNEW